MDASTVLTGGGIASLLVAIAYVGKMLLDWRHTPTSERVSTNAAVADAQAANAILNTTLVSLQAENGRLSIRVANLETEAEIKDRKIDELEARLNQIAVELSSLKSTH